MGTISASGLISGLDVEGIITKLMAIEKRPITLLQSQITKLTTERTTFMTISAQLLALKLTVTPFKSGVTFRPNKATSSDENSLTATANSSAAAGKYSFMVKQTAQTHQMISQGFNDSDRSAIGAGTISFETGRGNLDRDTLLSFLKNQQGIRRGIIRITDRSGASANVDLSTAMTVSDVVKAINEAEGINVQARTTNNQLVVEDLTGSTTSNLIVQDLNKGYTAGDLGIAGSVAGASITSSDLIGITDNTQLKFLNDGNGIDTNSLLNDLSITMRDGTTQEIEFNRMTLDTALSRLNNGQGVRLGKIKLTNRAGQTQTVDLSSAKTVGDVASAISGAGINLSVIISGNSKLNITDGSSGTGKLKIENDEGSYAATDLGIAGEVSGTALVSKEIYRVSTLGDVKRAIEDITQGKISVSVSAGGKGLTVTDTTIGTGTLVISSLNDSNTAESLGIAGTFSGGQAVGTRIVGGMNSVLLKNLNGGKGVAAGQIEIQDRTGASTTVDLSAAETLQDVIDAINSAGGVQVQAQVNQSKTGIIISDLSGSTDANLKITDINSTTAQDLKISIDRAVSQSDSENNQLKYISKSTLLSSLKGGQGLGSGTFTITDSMGHRATVAAGINELSTMTIGDMIDRINSSGMINVHAEINENGDGILITDTAGGMTKMKIANDGTSSLASDLNLAGEADAAGAGSIDGSFEYKIDIGGSDTLTTLAEKINALKGPVTATILNDGTGMNSYRLSLISKYSGKTGQFFINSSSAGLQMADLVEGQDAIINLGGSTTNPIVTSSSTNTFTGLIPGLTLNAVSSANKAVDITVTRDTETVNEKVSSFVEKFNSVLTSIKDATKYVAETETAGPLLGNLTADTINTKLYNMITKSISNSGSITRLSELGFSLDSSSKLVFDEDKFNSSYEANPTAVESFFSTMDTGFGYALDTMLDELTRSGDGTITRTTDSYQDRTDMLNERITYLNELLTNKEQRLYRQFQNMETALAKMQTMSSALSSISLLTTSTSNSSSSSSSS